SAAVLTVAGFIIGLSFKRTVRYDPKLVPLTAYPGIEGPPSLSPDGNQVAFQRDGDIFVKQVDGEPPLQLTDTPVEESAPTWSPDGRRIAFIRGGSGIFLISPLGGGQKKIAETRAPWQAHMQKMAWTPDNKSLIVSELVSSVTSSLFLVSVETGKKKRITW